MLIASVGVICLYFIKDGKRAVSQSVLTQELNITLISKRIDHNLRC